MRKHFKSYHCREVVVIVVVVVVVRNILSTLDY